MCLMTGGILESNSHFHLLPSLPTRTQLPFYNSVHLLYLFAWASQSFQLFEDEQGRGVRVSHGQNRAFFKGTHLDQSRAPQEHDLLGSISDVEWVVHFNPKVKNNQLGCWTAQHSPQKAFLVTDVFLKFIKNQNEQRCQVVLLHVGGSVCNPSCAVPCSATSHGTIIRTKARQAPEWYSRIFLLHCHFETSEAWSQGPTIRQAIGIPGYPQPLYKMSMRLSDLSPSPSQLVSFRKICT